MCTCASCKHTDGFAAKGFAAWPSGDPGGKRASDAAYRGHLQHAAKWGGKYQPEFTASELKGGSVSDTGGGYRYVRPKGCYPGTADAKAGLAAYVSAFEYLNGLKPQPPAPSATIYVMADEKAKRPVGRPPLDGVKRVLVSLDRASLERARALGGGKNVSAGIRAALSATEPKAASGAGS